MKFTIDTEEKIIYFKEPFTKGDIEYVLSILNIQGIDTWKISMENPVITSPTITPGTTTPYHYPNTLEWWGTPTITCDGVEHRFTNTSGTHNIELTDIYN